jgi:hypothetical protein
LKLIIKLLLEKSWPFLAKKAKGFEGAALRPWGVAKPKKGAKWAF